MEMNNLRYEILKSDFEQRNCDSLGYYNDLEEAEKKCQEFADNGEFDWDYEVWDAKTEQIVFRADHKEEKE